MKLDKCARSFFNMIPDSRRCQECDGEGEITIPRYHSWDGYAESYKECEACGGTGERDETDEDETDEDESDES